MVLSIFQLPTGSPPWLGGRKVFSTCQLRGTYQLHTAGNLSVTIKQAGPAGPSSPTCYDYAAASCHCSPATSQLALTLPSTPGFEIQAVWAIYNCLGQTLPNGNGNGNAQRQYFILCLTILQFCLNKMCRTPLRLLCFCFKGYLCMC